MAVEPLWLTADEVVAIHENQIELYGGLPGFKDRGLVESAVVAPQNASHYEGEEDVLMLALILCRAIAKNHGFLDGNKRAAAASMLMFLELNGYEVHIYDGDTEEPWLGRMVERIAASTLDLPNFYAAFVPYVHPIQD